MNRQLRSTLGRLELAFSLVAESIVWTGGDGRVQWCNHSFDALVGLSHIDLLGKDLVDLLPLERDGQRVPRASHPVTAVCEGQLRVSSAYELPRPDRRLIVEVDAMGATIASEEPTIMVVIRDVTARTHAMEEMRLLNAELEAANKELQAFGYSVSHDLRAPLRAIDGFSELLLEEYESLLDARGQGYLHHIRTAVQSMSQLIDALLLLSRVTEMDLVRATINLAELARTTVSDLQREHPERQVEFLVTDVMEAEGDSRLLRVVIENLLSNAWKFTARRAGATIEFGSARREGQVVYFVRDNGVGFDPIYASKLFAPFQRLHSAVEFPGAGIGLATVQRIIRRHGGHAWAEGAVDQGATFSFTLSASV